MHSYKDVPVTMPLVDQSGLTLVSTPMREDASDVMVFPCASDLEDRPRAAGLPSEGGIARLAQRARVGTGSMRRRCQLLAIRPDLRVELVRGNIDTRLRKLANDEFDAIVLAYAGLHRAGMFDAARMIALSDDEMLPAPGQGALALQCRRDDERTANVLRGINDAETSTCVTAERGLVTALQGDCHSPIGARARVRGDRIGLLAAVGARDGIPPVIRASAERPVSSPQEVVKSVFDQLAAQGVMALLAG